VYPGFNQLLVEDHRESLRRAADEERLGGLSRRATALRSQARSTSPATTTRRDPRGLVAFGAALARAPALAVALDRLLDEIARVRLRFRGEQSAIDA